MSPETPNASITIAGERSQVVDIRKVRVHDDRIVLSVRGLAGALEAQSGPGAVFIDDVIVYPWVQTADLGDGVTATVTLLGPTALTATLDHNGTNDGSCTLTPRVYRPCTVTVPDMPEPLPYSMSAKFGPTDVVVTFTIPTAAPQPDGSNFSVVGVVSFPL